jgi:hypothetical protein
MGFDSDKDLSAEDSLKVFEELELNQPKSVMEVRCVDEVEVQAKVWVEAGNFSDRDGSKLVGVSSRIGQLSLTTLFPQPLKVGDVYRITFDRDSLDLDPAFAVCKRCRYVNDDTFESMLAFFAPVNIGGS